MARWTYHAASSVLSPKTVAAVQAVASLLARQHECLPQEGDVFAALEVLGTPMSVVSASQRAARTDLGAGSVSFHATSAPALASPGDLAGQLQVAATMTLGGGIEPRAPELLTERDVDAAPFHCCGDEDLVFLRCPSCGHIWVECYECSTWYVDLNDLTRRESSVSSTVTGPVRCPACRAPFADEHYLQKGSVDRYLPTATQVIEAGFERYLARHLRAREPSWTP